MLTRIIKNYTLYTGAFFAALYFYEGGISQVKGYGFYYAAFMISWAAAVILTRKFKNRDDYPFISKLYTYTISFFLMLGILSFIIFQFNLIGVSRFVILSSLILSFSIEIYNLIRKNKSSTKLKNIELRYSSKAFSFEVVLFGIVNLFIIYKLEGNFLFNIDNLTLFAGLYLSWFLGSLLGYQFNPAFRRKDYWAFKWRYIKSYIIILALSSFIAFLLRLNVDEVATIVYGVILYSALSFIGTSVGYYILKHRLVSLSIANFPVKGIFGDILLNEDNPIRSFNYRISHNNRNSSETSESKFKNFSLQRYPEVYEFLDKSIDLRSFDYDSSLILKSNNVSNIDYLPNGDIKFLLNLETVNRIQNTNEFLSEVNKKLVTGGIYAGHFETSYLRHQSFLKKYPYYFGQLIYFIDFILNRVFPKLSFSKRIYFWLTGGTQRVITLAEGLGRLYFSGFEVLNLKILNGTMFFIVKKIKEPIKNVIPSTGLIFKMRRLGKGGKPIVVYKFRTMHAYSEYLQEFIYKKFDLQEGGKFKNDFRITYWGGILRKLWIDELPMIYNLIKGDLKLVGPRPLSQHYFNLYNEELKKKRLQCKPGLIPPFYADNPKTLDEIMISEQKYLISYSKDYFITDVKYFFHCFHNILFNGARSN